MMILFHILVLPCTSALTNFSHFVFDVVQAVPTDVSTRLQTSELSKLRCGMLCSKEYVSVAFTLNSNTCQCFSEVSLQAVKDITGTSGVVFAKLDNMHAVGDFVSLLFLLHIIPISRGRWWR